VYYSVLQCAAVCCSLLQCVVEGDSFLFTLCLVCVRAHTQVDLCITIRCVYCSVLQCVAVCFTRCCSELHLTITQHTCKHVCCSMLHYKQVCVLQCVAVCCSTSRYVRCSVLQCVAPHHHPTHTLRQVHNLAGGYLGMHAAVCCSMLQYVAVCCSMLQCVVRHQLSTHSAPGVQSSRRGTRVLDYFAICCSASHITNHQHTLILQAPQNSHPLVLRV